MMRYRLDKKGQELVEYALILPILLLLIFGIIDFGVTIFVYNSISNAAREGARAGIVPSATDQDIIDAVTERTGGVALTADNVTITRTETLTSSRTQVEVAYDHRLLTGPVIRAVSGNSGNSELTLRSVASMRNE